MYSRFDRAIKELEETGETKLRAIGNSMTPKIPNHSLLTLKKFESYKLGDMVLCKVRGNWYESHLVTGIRAKGCYQISNNHGHVNGWTRKVYGKVVKIILPRK